MRHWTVQKRCELCESSPGSRLRTSTDSLRGEILSAATTHSALRPRLYSTRKAVIGDPPLALGIQVTYTELSVAMEMVGWSGASGTGRETGKEQLFESCKLLRIQNIKYTERTGKRRHCIATHVKDGTSSQRKKKKKEGRHDVEECVLTAWALSHKVREGRRE